MKFLNLSSILVGSLLLAACGSGNNAATSCPAGQSLVNNVCTVSYGYNSQQTGYYGNGQYGQVNSCTAANGQIGVNTASGCLPQGNCQAGYGFTGTTCIVGTTTGYAQNSQCQAGMLMTNMGCLPQGNCQMGMGFSVQYNQCIQAMNTGYTGYQNSNNYNGGGVYMGWGAGLGYGYGQQQMYGQPMYNGQYQGGCPRGGYFYGNQMICY